MADKSLQVLLVVITLMGVGSRLGEALSSNQILIAQAKDMGIVTNCGTLIF